MIILDRSMETLGLSKLEIRMLPLFGQLACSIPQVARKRNYLEGEREREREFSSKLLGKEREMNKKGKCKWSMVRIECDIA